MHCTAAGIAIFCRSLGQNPTEIMVGGFTIAHHTSLHSVAAISARGSVLDIHLVVAVADTQSSSAFRNVGI